MGIFKKLTKGLKEKIVDPFKGFVNRNKKALVTAAILAGVIYTGGAIAGWFPTAAAGGGGLALPGLNLGLQGVAGAGGTVSGVISGGAAGAAGGVGASTVAGSVATGAVTKAAGLAEAKVTTGQDPFRKPEPEVRGQLQPLAVEGQTMSKNLEFGFGSYLG